MKYLDGKRLRKAVNAGSLWLDRHRESLNAINVFPVADGDTGSNMALTLKAAVMGANRTGSDALQDVADSIALHSLRGAQGNSGVILSQYFKGVAEHIRRRKRLGPDEVADVFEAGADSAYKALKDPKEGTILTVIREMAEHLRPTKNRFSNLRNLIHSALERGKTSLIETKTKLKVLADAGVVDAGGQGFVHFIEGIYNFMKTGETAAQQGSTEEIAVIPGVIRENSNYRYCAEFLVKGRGFDTESVKKTLEEQGDSLIVACMGDGGSQYLRIHIHTDTPYIVRHAAVALGELETSKIDDMNSQNIFMRRQAAFVRKPVKTVRIVTDSASDLPREIAEFNDIEIVPLKVIFGGESFRDGRDIDNEGFYRMLAANNAHPTTSQPSPGEVSDVYEKTFSRGDCGSIISIHLSSKLSGTYNSALIAGEKFEGRVFHFDSGTVSLGLGLQAIAASEMARNGYSAESILGRLEEFKANQKLFFSLGSIDYLIKGGRVGRAKGFLGKLLGLRPLLSLDDGEVVPVGKGRSDHKLMETIFSIVSEDCQGYRWAAGHAAAPSRLAEIESHLKEKLGIDNILTGEIGPVVGTHAGPGSWGIFCMKG